jgi:hypothetical protein
MIYQKSVNESGWAVPEWFLKNVIVCLICTKWQVIKLLILHLY